MAAPTMAPATVRTVKSSGRVGVQVDVQSWVHVNAQMLRRVAW
jgi:hypothetical protein